MARSSWSASSGKVLPAFRCASANSVSDVVLTGERAP